MSFHETDFEFDNKKSTEFPIYIVHLESGMVSSEISGSRSMVYDKVPYNDNIYFYRTDTEIMKFSIVVSPLEEEWTEELKFELFKWLYSRSPKSFKSCDFIGKHCFCVCTNALSLTNNGQKQGYIELEFEATTNYWLSDIEISTFDFSDITSLTTFEIYAKFNVPHPKYNDYIYFPKLNIDLKGNTTSLSIINQSDSGRTFGFTGLTTLESLEIDNEMKQITSSTGNSRIDNLTNHNWFRLVAGRNLLTIDNKCILQIISEYPCYI